MGKIDSLHKGRIWLNVYRTDDGKIEFTLHKSYPTKGGWRCTNFFRADQDDIKDIAFLLQQFNSLQGIWEIRGVDPSTPSLGFCPQNQGGGLR
jgi:hypothetical protein